MSELVLFTKSKCMPWWNTKLQKPISVLLTTWFLLLIFFTQGFLTRPDINLCKAVSELSNFHLSSLHCYRSMFIFRSDFQSKFVTQPRHTEKVCLYVRYLIWPKHLLTKWVGTFFSMLEITVKTINFCFANEKDGLHIFHLFLQSYLPKYSSKSGK